MECQHLLIILRAVKKSNYKPEIICIEPFPTDYLIREHNKGKINLRKEMAQLTDIKYT